MTDQSRKTTKTAIICEKLQEDIINNVFSAGDRLPLSALKERYQVGATPLREALSRLSSQGFVELEEQCGFRIPTLSISELHDIYFVRESIMKTAIELAMSHKDDNWEAELLTSHHRLSRYITSQNKIDIQEWEKRQKDFFQTIIKGAKSPWLSKIHDLLYDQAARYRMLCLQKNYFNKKLLDKVSLENQTLVENILARNLKKSLTIIQQIYQDTIQSIEDILTTKTAH